MLSHNFKMNNYSENKCLSQIKRFRSYQSVTSGGRKFQSKQNLRRDLKKKTK